MNKSISKNEVSQLITQFIALSITLITTLVFSSQVLAHFQEIIPDRDFADVDHQQPISFAIQFTHPMSQGPVMNMEKPKKLRVLNNLEEIDLLPSIKKATNPDKGGISTWVVSYLLKKPGDHIFYIEPQPYWEEDENKMIVHFTKVIVDAYGDLTGWDSLIGLPVEIEPLTRPYSLWAGNAFQGIVKKNGEAVPFAEIEVEWRNDGSIKNVPDNYVTQVIKADANGTFSYVMPRAGWWGFAALLDADYQLTSPKNTVVDVELGALMWVNAKKMPQESK